MLLLHFVHVLWIRTDAPGITDEEVLARRLEDARVLLTFDKDFGELAWRSGLPASCGIVFRLSALGPRNRQPCDTLLDS